MISIAFKSGCLSLYDDCMVVELKILLILHGTASALTSSLDEFISLGKSLWVRDRDINILEVHYSYSSQYQKAHVSSKTVKSSPGSCVKLRDSIFFACWWHPCVCVQFSSVAQSCRLFATRWIAARQTSLSITNSWSSLRFTSIESVIPSSHLILCRPLLLLPPIPPSIRVFSNESALCMRWPKYWTCYLYTIPRLESHLEVDEWGRCGFLGLTASQRELAIG